MVRALTWCWALLLLAYGPAALAQVAPAQPASAQPVSPWPDLASLPPDLRPMTRDEEIKMGGAGANIGGESYGGAASGWEKARDLHLASYGPDHPRTALIRLRLAEHWIDLRRYQDAERELLLAERTLLARAEKGHPARFNLLAGWSLLLGRQQRIAEQIAIIERILDELSVSAAREPGRPIAMDSWRGMLAARRGDYAAAEGHLRANLDQIAASPTSTFSGKAWAAESLASHLIDMGRGSEATALLAPFVTEARKDEKTHGALLAVLLETTARVAEEQYQFERSTVALLKARELRQDDYLTNYERMSAWRLATRLHRQRLLERRFDLPMGVHLGPNINRYSAEPDTIPAIADGISALITEAAADVNEASPFPAGETLPLRRDLLAWYERAFGADHPVTARARRALAALQLDMGKPYSAERELQRSLAATRAALPGLNDEVGRSLLLLGRVYLAQGRRAEALAAYEEALRHFDRPQSPNSYWTHEALLGAGRTSDLLRDEKRSAAIWKRFESVPTPAADEVSVPIMRQMLSLAQALVARDNARKQCLSREDRDKFAETLRQMKTFLAATPGTIDTGYYTLAEAAACAGDFDAAAQAITEASVSALSMFVDASPRGAESAAIRQTRLVRLFMADKKRMASDHLETTPLSGGIAAMTAFQSATDISWTLARAEGIAQSLLTGAIANGSDLDAIRARSQMEEGGRSIFDFVFSTRLDFDWLVHELRNGPGPVLETRFQGKGTGAAIIAAQELERAGAAQVLAQSSARLAAGDTAIGAVLRRREQLSADQRRLAAAISQATIAGSSFTYAEPIDAMRGRSETVISELAAIDARLQKDYPDYFALTRPQSFSIATIQEKLGEQDGLLLIRPHGDDVHVFVVTREKMAWNRLTGSAPEIAALVSDLRCNIDAATCGKAGDGGSRGATRGPPRLRSGSAGPIEGWQAPAFDRNKAWRLYSLLFDPIDKVFAQDQAWEKPINRLYTVVSGPLSALPLGALVTAKPADDGISTRGSALLDTPWLAERFTLIGLPSVSSLGLKPPPAGSAGADMIGYGDPVLGIRQSQTERVASFLSMVSREDDRMRARPNALRALDPLPGTRTELEAIAGLFYSGRSQIHLQGAATEAAVKRDRMLTNARIVIFSTHGLLPGEVEGNVEPGLVLTPPELASDLDDGLLTASEAATLSLDADLLVLSACNTATTDGTPGAESLSSLARSFLYAGTRGIYASHWRVSDEVTSRLTQIALGFRRDGRTRAEALAAAMQAIRTGAMPDGTAIPNWTPDWAHPAAWAPFVIISGIDG